VNRSFLVYLLLVSCVAGDNAHLYSGGAEDSCEKSSFYTEAYVYEDLNGNGTKDPGEPGISGANVTLSLPGGSVKNLTTNGDGKWSMIITQAGNVNVSVDQGSLPALNAYTQSENTMSTDYVITTGGLASQNGPNYGYAPLSASGVIYIDTDGNGVQDAGEPGASGVSVEITTPTMGIVYAMTNNNGEYHVILPEAGSMSMFIDQSLHPQIQNPLHNQTENTGTTVFSVTSGVTTIQSGPNYGYHLAVPDLTIGLSVLPGVVNGTSAGAAEVVIQELTGNPTHGSTMTIKIIKSPKFAVTWDPSATGLGPFNGWSNVSWVYDSTDTNFHIWTSNLIIGGLSSLKFGMNLTFDSLGETGNSPIHGFIEFGSGGEVDNQNNYDKETISYFP